jgi:ribose transport system ATP-binding protein
MTTFKCEKIRKSFFGQTVLRDVSFDLFQGRILGLVGENGAGKSTLMNIVGGVLKPDSGRMEIDGREFVPQDPSDAANRGIAFIHQELNLFTNLSIAENIYLTSFPKRGAVIDGKETNRRAKEILDRIKLNVSPSTLVEELPAGERQLVEIGKALAQDARIIIFDEPTTSLTSREKQRLFEILFELKSKGFCVVYISHILEDIFALCDNILVLRDGQVVGYGERSEFDTESLVSLMVGRRLDQLYPERTSRPTDELLLELKGVSQPGVVENINLKVFKGEVVGIAGLMGAGRSELARIIFGLDPYSDGSIIFDNSPLPRLSPETSIRRGMAYLTEDRREEGLLMDGSISDNISLTYLTSRTNFLPGFVEKSISGKVKELAGRVRVTSRAERLPVKSLSGGNQQKVVIAKWLLNGPKLFILDEPTRGIDVGAKFDIYKLIDEQAAYGTGLIVISSEIEELIGICDRILVMNRGEIAGSYRRAEFNREEILKSALRSL